jgi:hypothetical protein
VICCSYLWLGLLWVSINNNNFAVGLLCVLVLLWPNSFLDITKIIPIIIQKTKGGNYEKDIHPDYFKYFSRFSSQGGQPAR